MSIDLTLENHVAPIIITITMHRLLQTSVDVVEGTKAFAGKRVPAFTGAVK